MPGRAPRGGFAWGPGEIPCARRITVRGIALTLGLAMLACAGAAFAADRTAPISARGSIVVAFPPWDDAETLIVEAIGRARREVLVQAFSFSSRPIARALIAAQRRGVRVRILADREQLYNAGGSRIPELAMAGIPVSLEVRYASAHNKVMVIDAVGADPVVITGSYNWTWSAQNRNAENVLLLKGNAELARRYAANWERHAEDALPYQTALP